MTTVYYHRILKQMSRENLLLLTFAHLQFSDVLKFYIVGV